MTRSEPVAVFKLSSSLYDGCAHSVHDRCIHTAIYAGPSADQLALVGVLHFPASQPSAWTLHHAALLMGAHRTGGLVAVTSQGVDEVLDELARNDALAGEAIGLLAKTAAAHPCRQCGQGVRESLDGLCAACLDAEQCEACQTGAH